jgi:hypothetical protein
MFSLALIVSVILFILIVSGPFVFLLSRLDIVPNFIVYILGIMTIFCSLWFLTIPVPIVRFTGIFSAALAILAIRGRQQKIKG